MSGGRGERTPIEGALRLFVGVRVSLAAAATIGDAAAGLRRAAAERGIPMSFAAPAGYHVTLAFLGWTRPEAVAALRDRVGDALAGARAFELSTAGLGAFPSPERARVVWVAISAGERALTELATRVRRATDALGFPREERPFHPHVTLARVKQASDCRALLATPSERLRSTSWCDSVVLFESRTKSSGSEYTPLVEWSLEGASKSQKRQTRPVERAPDTRQSDRNLAPERGPEESDHGEGTDGDDQRPAR